MQKSTYQFLRDNHEEIGVSRGAVQHWYRTGKVPLEHAIVIDKVFQGKFTAQCLTGGYSHTHAESLLANKLVDEFDSDSPLTAEILNYLEIAQPFLYEWVVRKIDPEYIKLRNLHRGEADVEALC